MEHCPNKQIYDSLSSSFDRLEEAAWFIKLMEENYHSANEFRWSLNSFLRTLKEIMQLLTMETQSYKDVTNLVTEKKAQLIQDPLIAYLYKQRDIVVHKSMLKPASHGSIGFTRGKGMKLALGSPIDPLSDSQEAIKRYIYFAAKEGDTFGFLYTEEDGSGEYTCVERKWKLEQFPDLEITELAASAWEKVAQALFDIARSMGAQLIEPKFTLADPNHVRFEIYNPKWIKMQLEYYKSWITQNES